MVMWRSPYNRVPVSLALVCYGYIPVLHGLKWIIHQIMMMSSNGNIFHVTGSLCGELTGHRWIPLTKASDMEFWYFLWSVPELTIG